MKSWIKHIVWFLLPVLFSCEDSFTPDVIENPKSLLVVDGYINSNGVTSIALSRTQSLSDNGTKPVVRGATVKLEEENGQSYNLPEVEPGIYRLPEPGLVLNEAKKYRITIRAGGNEYASAFVQVQRTPAIDEVTWEADEAGLNIMVSTHDPENDTRYYRWDFEETWEFTSVYNTTLDYVNNQVVYRDKFSKPIYRCWQTQKSTTINLGTTEALQQDIVQNKTLLQLPKNSDKARIKYSVLVKQMAQTKESFKYLELLRKNTESIGSLFDPIPSQLTGNIRNLKNPEEPVIGYIGASSVEEKRIFIDHEELPEDWRIVPATCILDTIPKELVRDYMAAKAVMLVSELSEIGAYSVSQPRCVDCTIKGSNVRPSYWQ